MSRSVIVTCDRCGKPVPLVQLKYGEEAAECEGMIRFPHADASPRDRSQRDPDERHELDLCAPCGREVVAFATTKPAGAP